MKKAAAAFTITFAMIFSLRVVAIATPLNIYEQFAFVGMMIDFTLQKSREL